MWEYFYPKKIGTALWISQYLTNLMHKICFTISFISIIKLIVKQIWFIKLVKYWDNFSSCFAIYTYSHLWLSYRLTPYYVHRVSGFRLRAPKVTYFFCVCVFRTEINFGELESNHTDCDWNKQIDLCLWHNLVGRRQLRT